MMSYDDHYGHYGTTDLPLYNAPLVLASFPSLVITFVHNLSEKQISIFKSAIAESVNKKKFGK